MAKILLVEDNEMNRDMLSRRLLKRGFTVEVAVDGVEGVASAIEQRPDLILMDLSLPGLDGWEATRRIKADAGLAGTPVIALTAHAMEGDRERVLEGAQTLGVWQGDGKEAGDALWAYCQAIIYAYTLPSLRIGSPEDDLMDRLTRASTALLRYPEIRASSELIFHFRALSGLYSLGRRLQPEANWGALLRANAQYAADRAQGRLPS